MTDLARLGIHIESHGDRLRYSPRSAVTPELADRMKAHRAELLAILSPNAERSAIQWCENAPRHEVQAALETAMTEWDVIVESDGPVEITDAIEEFDDWTGGTANPDDVPTCGTCGRQEAWQTLLGNWRCLRCDPPTMARRLREREARRKTDRTDWLRMNARGDP